MQLQKSYTEITDAGLQVVAISYDDAEVVEAFAKQGKIKFSLLADPGSKVIEQFGMLNGSASEGSPKYRISHPGTFIVDRSGTILSKLSGTVIKRHSGEQLLEAWGKVKEKASSGPFAGDPAGSAAK